MELTLIAAVVVIVGLALVAELAATARRRQRSDRLLVHERVMVTLKTGTAVAGLVVEHGPGYHVLADAMVYETGAANGIPADGTMVVYRENVDYTQRVNGRR